ncbi:MAG: SDR family oxidoreductase, partial [bacterium]|nr:SDR family oxidoreductase [bacterium]
PIAIEDVVSYLAEAILLPHGDSRIFEIGGADRVSYGQIMREYARQRGLRRVIIPAPVLTPRLSSLWLTLVSPVHAKVGRLLIDGLRNPTLVRDDSARSEFSIQPMGIREATERALAYEDREFAETRWSDALSSSPNTRPWGGQRFGSRLIDSRTATVSGPPENAFRPIRRIGGASGWYYANWLWRIRGLVDSFLGGVGLRRGRKNPETVQVGDTLD